MHDFYVDPKQKSGFGRLQRVGGPRQATLANDGRLVGWIRLGRQVHLADRTDQPLRGVVPSLAPCVARLGTSTSGGAFGTTHVRLLSAQSPRCYGKDRRQDLGASFIARVARVAATQIENVPWGRHMIVAHAEEAGQRTSDPERGQRDCRDHSPSQRGRSCFGPDSTPLPRQCMFAGAGLAAGPEA